MHCLNDRNECSGTGQCYCMCTACLGTPEPGKLFFGKDDGGPRHFLDGEAVHCGETLEMRLEDGTWVKVRYEANLYATPAKVSLYAAPWGENGPQVIVEYPMGQTLRWPDEDRRAALEISKKLNR